MLFGLLLSSVLTLVELNAENLFDWHHDSLKQDTEFLPEGVRRWTPTRYWRKVNHIAQAILATSDDLPDLVALCEVENDTVLHDLTRRSLLRGAGYEYLMTESPDMRGIDVALLYQPARFRPLCYECIEVPPVMGMRPTRDLLYIRGVTVGDDTLHLLVVHAPSQYGGPRLTRPFRRQVVNTVLRWESMLGAEAQIIIVGDFNEGAAGPSLVRLREEGGLTNVTQKAKGRWQKVQGTYRYQGQWESIDHVLVSSSVLSWVQDTYVVDAPFLLEEDEVYGGYVPRRTYHGYRYQCGFSDHLPLVVKFRIP